MKKLDKKTLHWMFEKMMDKWKIYCYSEEEIDEAESAEIQISGFIEDAFKEPQPLDDLVEKIVDAVTGNFLVTINNVHKHGAKRDVRKLLQGEK